MERFRKFQSKLMVKRMSLYGCTNRLFKIRYNIKPKKFLELSEPRETIVWEMKKLNIFNSQQQLGKTELYMKYHGRTWCLILQPI